MQGFLEYVVKGLVGHPDEVSVTSVERNGLMVYELRLDPSDIGKVVGRQGMTITAIRSLLQAGSGKKGFRSMVKIIEDEGEDENSDLSAEQESDSETVDS
ncbi:MAG TPA: KH domain-containing protein [Verrucomicrobiales bacterium]|nr:KH domain-containing protein [Verrucomicrobiales bacterium]HIL72406.1 KH domain-containing protein [Verrucomicrobiota bacterium]